jgi:4-amino-4-deoxy-L-arabinose transferase-like glycosyltransferase
VSRVFRHCVPVVIGVSLLAQLAAVRLRGAFEPRSVPVDYLNRYRPQAETILAGGGMLLRGEPRTPPAYPLALAGAIALCRGHGVGPDAAARLLNLVLMALAAALLTAAVRRAVGERAALCSGLAFATYPFAVYLGLAPGPEPLYLFSLSLTAWLIAATMGSSPWWAAAAGALAGYSMLVKPIGILLPLFYAAAYLMMGRQDRGPGSRYARPALVLAAAALAVLPWQVYLRQHDIRNVLLSSLGGATAYEGWTYGLAAGAGGDRADLPADVIALMGRIAGEGKDASLTRLFGVVARKGSERPAAFAKLAALKLVRPWFGTDEQWHERTIALVQALYLLAAVAGLVLWLGSRNGRALMAPLAAIMLCHWLMAFATMSILRYMMPMSFLLAVCIGVLAGRIWPGRRADAVHA